MPKSAASDTHPYTTIDITGKMILLGTGTSVGVPSIGCGCDVCTSDHPRNSRTRCSVIMGLPEGNLLIDTTPDLRFQLLREKIGIVHAVAYTHDHADHILGLDDLRLFQFYLGGPIPLYCEPNVEKRLRRTFDYAFLDRQPTHPGAAPALQMHTISTMPFQVLGATVLPLRLQHGPHFEVLGFRIGNIAYCTDTNHIPLETRGLLNGLDVLILDSVRRTPHATHFGLDEAVVVAQEIGAKRTFFTHTSHALDYEATNASLPHNMELAYDGQQLLLT